MKILLINVTCGIGSTGRICVDIAEALNRNGHEVKIAYGREAVPHKYSNFAERVGSEEDVINHAVRARLFDSAGFCSKKVTQKFIEWIRTFDPDVIHLHNVHGYYINVDILFRYLHTCGKKIIWTLHDCWAFTGHSAYCDAADCTRWINGCHNCPNKNKYPASILDRSSENWKRKRKIFNDIPNMRIVTPSEWLETLVKKSFLSDYKTNAIYNGVNTKVFKPAKDKRISEYEPDNRKIILGVASVWDERKGLQEFYELAKIITDDYVILLVGLDRKKTKKLPCNIKVIKKTQNIQALAALYSMAEVYINPTWEDNYPTTNLEAIACGTPVITFDTGGSGESAKLFGSVVPKGDISELWREIQGISIINSQPDYIKMIDKEKMAMDYFRLYSQY